MHVANHAISDSAFMEEVQYIHKVGRDPLQFYHAGFHGKGGGLNRLGQIETAKSE
jgi:hypothetical protein